MGANTQDSADQTMLDLQWLVDVTSDGSDVTITADFAKRIVKAVARATTPDQAGEIERLKAEIFRLETGLQRETDTPSDARRRMSLYQSKHDEKAKALAAFAKGFV